MQTTVPNRLPITATIAALIAFVALYLSLGGGALLVILGLALVASYFADTRFEAKITGGSGNLLCASCDSAHPLAALVFRR